MTIPIPNVQSWPLNGLISEGQMRWSHNDTSVRECLLNILLTRPGERLQRPDFGAGLMNFVHQPNNETTRNLMASVVRKSIQLWENRIYIESVEVTPSAENLADVHINIRYRMKHLNQPAELGLTFTLGNPR